MGPKVDQGLNHAPECFFYHNVVQIIEINISEIFT